MGTCYLRSRRGVVNSETLKWKFDGTNHEFTRIGTNNEEVCFKHQFTHRQLVEA